MAYSVTSNTSSKRKRRTRETKTYQRSNKLTQSTTKRLKKSKAPPTQSCRDLTHDDDHKAEEPPIITPSIQSTAPPMSDIPKSPSSNSTAKRRRRRRRRSKPPSEAIAQPTNGTDSVPRTAMKASHIVTSSVPMQPEEEEKAEEQTEEESHQRKGDSSSFSMDRIKEKKKKKIKNLESSSYLTQSCDIDLSRDDAEEGDWIRFKTSAYPSQIEKGWMFGQVILRKDHILDVKVIDAEDEQHEIIIVDTKLTECEVLEGTEKIKIMKQAEENENEKKKKKKKEKKKKEEKRMETEHDEEDGDTAVDEQIESEIEVVEEPKTVQFVDSEHVEDGDVNHEDSHCSDAAMEEVPPQHHVRKSHIVTSMDNHETMRQEIVPSMDVGEDGNDVMDNHVETGNEGENRKIEEAMDIDPESNQTAKDPEHSNPEGTESALKMDNAKNVMAGDDGDDNDNVDGLDCVDGEEDVDIGIQDAAPKRVETMRKEVAPFLVINTPATETSSMRMAVHQLSLPPSGTNLKSKPKQKPKFTKYGTEIMPQQSDHEENLIQNEEPESRVQSMDRGSMHISSDKAPKADVPSIETIKDHEMTSERIAANVEIEKSPIISDHDVDIDEEHHSAMAMDVDTGNHETDHIESKAATPHPTSNQKEERTDDEHDEEQLDDDDNGEMNQNVVDPTEDRVETIAETEVIMDDDDDVDDLNAKINALCGTDSTENGTKKKTKNKKKNKQFNPRKESIIIVPDSDPSQQEDVEDSASIASRPLKAFQPIQFEHPLMTPHHHQTLSAKKMRVRHHDINSWKTPTPHSMRKRTKRTPSSRSRKRPKLTLKDSMKTTKRSANSKTLADDGLAAESMANHRDKVRKQRREVIDGIHDADNITTPYTSDHGRNVKEQRERNVNQHQIRENQENVVPMDLKRNRIGGRNVNDYGYGTKAVYGESLRKVRKESPQRPLRQIQSKMERRSIMADRSKSKSTPPDIRHSPRSSKKRRRFEDDGNEENDELVYKAPPRKKARNMVMLKEKGTQTEGAYNMIDVRQIEAQISMKFKKLFENLFRDKVRELKKDNEAFRRFLQEKAERITDLHAEYGAKIKMLQNDVFSKMGKDILTKWKDDVMDSIEQLEEHASTIHDQQSQQFHRNERSNAIENRVPSQMMRRNNSEDIVHQIEKLLSDYHGHNV